MGFFLKADLGVCPLFSLFIAVPAIFSIFTPGEPLAVFKIAGFSLVITRQGLSGAGLFLARVVTSVSFAVLLSITTRHFALLKVLRVFKIPQVFVMTFGMCYRYIYLLLRLLKIPILPLKAAAARKSITKEASALWPGISPGFGSALTA